MNLLAHLTGGRYHSVSGQEALDEARQMAGPDGRVVVTGSFYLVGPVAQALALYSPRRGI